MSIVAEKIQAIITELETGTNKQSRSAADVAQILLGETGQMGIDKQEKEQVTHNENIKRVCSIDMHNMEASREAANQTWELAYYRAIYSCRPIIGKAIVFGKRAVRKVLKYLIEPITKEQTQFNSNAVKTLNALRNNDIVFQANISQLLNETENNKEYIEKVNVSLRENNKQADELKTQIEVLNQKAMEQSKMVENAKIDELRTQIELLKQETARQSLVIEELMNRKKDNQVYENIDYFDFENHFRGSRADIKENQKAYIHYFLNCHHVIDIGCGRGELLELLKENGIDAVGVDWYEPFIDYCRIRGFAVVNQEGISYLKQQSDNSVDGIIGLQIAEHIAPDSLMDLCREAYRILEEGKKFILETPNPMCMSTYLNSFYLDPSHIKPVHPKTLEYFLKKAGFKNIHVIFTEQSKVNYRLPLLDVEGKNLAEFNDGINFLSDIMFGSQDYAIIAEK